MVSGNDLSLEETPFLVRSVHNHCLMCTEWVSGLSRTDSRGVESFFRAEYSSYNNNKECG